MSKYNVGAYIRLSRDESYSDSDSIDNQIKLADYYCENNGLEIVEKYIDKARNVIVHFSIEDYKEVWNLIEKLQAKIRLFEDLRSNLNKLYQEIPSMNERDIIGLYLCNVETNKRLVIEREILDARK